jgi:hypothetical protein
VRKDISTGRSCYVSALRQDLIARNRSYAAVNVLPHVTSYGELPVTALNQKGQVSSDMKMIGEAGSSSVLDSWMGCAYRMGCAYLTDGTHVLQSCTAPFRLSLDDRNLAAIPPGGFMSIRSQGPRAEGHTSTRILFILLATILICELKPSWSLVRDGTLKLPIVSAQGLEEFGDALTADATSGCSGKVILVSLKHRSYSPF